MSVREARIAAVRDELEGRKGLFEDIDPDIQDEICEAIVDRIQQADDAEIRRAVAALPITYPPPLGPPPGYPLD